MVFVATPRASTSESPGAAPADRADNLVDVDGLGGAVRFRTRMVVCGYTSSGGSYRAGEVAAGVDPSPPS